MTEDEADLFFHKQLLTGDSTDNIPGLYRMVGKKATAKILEPLESMTTNKEMFEYVRAVYLDGYRDVGMCLDEADDVVDRWLLNQGRCLWIRRAEGELWVSE